MTIIRQKKNITALLGKGKQLKHSKQHSLEKHNNCSQHALKSVSVYYLSTQTTPNVLQRFLKNERIFFKNHRNQPKWSI